MVPAPPPHPRLGINTCHEAKTNKKPLWVLFLCLFPSPGVSKSSLPGETNIHKIFRGKYLCKPTLIYKIYEYLFPI